MYKGVDEVVAKLSDVSFSQPHVKQVNKGSANNPRFQSVIDWQENVYMLDEVFGPFGWGIRPVASTSDYANGFYSYDVMLWAKAVTADGEVVTLERPGRGVGIVPRSALESDSEHDRQSHGAKSDAITNACKPLGDGFGLWLYNESKRKQYGEGSKPQQTNSAAAPSSNGRTGSGSGARPSEKQLAVLVKSGYTEEQVAGLDFKDWKKVLDAIFAKETPPIAPAGKKAVAPKAPKPVVAEETEDDEIPF
jgi:hypothetical protein